jgi:hypothetical protein
VCGLGGGREGQQHERTVVALASGRIPQYLENANQPLYFKIGLSTHILIGAWTGMDQPSKALPCIADFFVGCGGGAPQILVVSHLSDYVSAAKQFSLAP